MTEDGYAQSFDGYDTVFYYKKSECAKMPAGVIEEYAARIKFQFWAHTMKYRPHYNPQTHRAGRFPLTLKK
jgi:hypothetical protein